MSTNRGIAGGRVFRDTSLSGSDAGVALAIVAVPSARAQGEVTDDGPPPNANVLAAASRAASPFGEAIALGCDGSLRIAEWVPEAVVVVSVASGESSSVRAAAPVVCLRSKLGGTLPIGSSLPRCSGDDGLG